MERSNMVVFDLEYMLKVAPTDDYREGTRTIAKTLKAFLDGNGLFDPGASAAARTMTPTAWHVKESDLTDEGRAVVRRALYKWLASTDRTGSLENARILHKALDAVRSTRDN